MHEFISLGKFLLMCGNNWGDVMKDNDHDMWITDKS